MKLLLDTHVVLWAVLDHPGLTGDMRAALTDPQADLYVSAVTVWEVAIKRRLGKLPVPDNLFDQVRAAGGRALPITWAHASATAELPLHHGDPFDRLLIAQARCESLTLVTADRMFQHYDVALL